MANATEVKATAAEKRKQALDLRRAGWAYEDIASEVGWANKSSAFRAVKQAISEITRESANELLELELARLDDMFAGLYQQARNGDMFAVDRALKIIDQRARFLGLYDREPEDDNIARAGAALLAMVEAARVVNDANRAIPEAGSESR